MKTDEKTRAAAPQETTMAAAGGRWPGRLHCANIIVVVVTIFNNLLQSNKRSIKDQLNSKKRLKIELDPLASMEIKNRFII